MSSGGGFGSCVELCSSDANCTTDEKCCSNGCGHSCQKSQQIGRCYHTLCSIRIEGPENIMFSS